MSMVLRLGGEMDVQPSRGHLELAPVGRPYLERHVDPCVRHIQEGFELSLNRLVRQQSLSCYHRYRIAPWHRRQLPVRS